LICPILKAYKGGVTLSEILNLPLSWVFFLRNGLGEINLRREYFAFISKEEDKYMPDSKSGIVSGSKLDKVFNPGEWIEMDDPALESADSYKGFLAGHRGMVNNRYVSKSHRRYPK